VRDRACPTSGVALCCEMPARGLYSQLYEDCTHPNCEAGFRAQCTDFGGTISVGACVVEDTDSASDESGGGCSVHGGGRTPNPSTALLCLLGIALAARTRRRGSRNCP
jgi:MYXO-CTERM domain-containing protein